MVQLITCIGWGVFLSRAQLSIIGMVTVHPSSNMNKHNLFIQEAIIEAKKCNMSKKHGCVIVHRTRIISRGHNSQKWCSTLDSPCPVLGTVSLHAEVAAINNMKKNMANVDNIIMYVVRINNTDFKRDDDLIGTMNSKPCVNCMRCIEYHKIKKVFFTT